MAASAHSLDQWLFGMGGIAVPSLDHDAPQRPDRALTDRLGSRYSGYRRSESLDFNDDFCAHRATSLKPDGKDILSVTMHLRAEADAEADAESIVPVRAC
jgi:hypothetical protein